MPEIRLCLATCSGEASAQRLAHALVERRLAACVNIIPRIRSVYRWKGAVHDDPEALLVIKTSQDRIEDLRQAIDELHEYDLPEFIVLAVDQGSCDYLDWVAHETRDE